MSPAIERLQEENRADAARLDARTRLVRLMNRTIEGLEAAGFKPDLVLEDSGLLCLTVDPDAIGTGPVLLPAPGRANEDPEPATDEPDLAIPADGAAPTSTPRPADTPAPASTPKGARRSTKKRLPTPSTLVSGPYSDDEIATVIRMIGDEATNAEITEALHRDRRGVNITVARLKKEMAADAATEQEATPTPEVQTSPAVQPSAPPETTASPEINAPETLPATPTEFDPTVPYAERECLAQLNAVGFPGRWTPALTLQLVEALSRGDGLSQAATACGVEKEIARMRWKKICPDPSWEAQKLLLQVLRRLADRGAA